MKILFLITLFIGCITDGFSQLVLRKKSKTVSLQTHPIRGIEAAKTLFLSYGDYKAYSRIKRYDSSQLFYLDTIKNIKQDSDTLELQARIIQYYRDTLTNAITSTHKIENEWRRGNFGSIPVIQDTSLRIALSDILAIKLERKNVKRADGMGILGMLVMGSVATIVSTVAVLKGDSDSFVVLGAGVGMLGLATHWIKSSRWLREFKISKNNWVLTQQ